MATIFHELKDGKILPSLSLFIILFTIKKRSYLSLRDKYEQLVHFLFINCLQMDFRKAIDILRGGSIM